MASVHFGRIFSDNVVSSGTFKEHLERLEIMICRLPRDLSDQRISERYNVLLGDLSHRVIRALAEKLQKLRKTAAIKCHRRWSSLRLLAIKPPKLSACDHTDVLGCFSRR